MEKNDIKTTIETVSPIEYAERIKNPEITVVDVRHADEYAQGHIKGSINIDVMGDDFIEKAKSELPKDKIVAVYCGTGKRSGLASEKLSEASFNILNLDGGLNAWKEAGLPLEA